MARYLLDTNIIIDLLKGQRGRDRLIADLLRQGDSLACCAINVAEIYAGLMPHQQEKTERLLQSFEYYEITWEIARKAGLLKRDWTRQGITIGLPDAILAALALTEDLTLITGNRRDFPMPELKLYPLSQAN